MKQKNVMLTVFMLLMGLMIIGGTYAYLTMQANVTNTNYVGLSTCFLVDYNIDNGDGTQNITGILFPSIGPSKGLNGRAGLKVKDECEVSGIGELKLHINNTTSSSLTQIATSHCEDKKTGDFLTEYSTEASCSSANQKWRSYPTSYCEDKNTLQTLKEYTTQASCTSHNGNWVTNGSPLKYAVYNTNNTNGIPVSVGHITSSNIGNDVTIYDNIILTHEQRYFYVYIWIDGYLTDNSHADLPFDGYIKASATQNDQLLPSEYQQVEYLESTGTQYIDTGYYWTHENIEIYFDGTVIENNSYQSLFGNEEYIDNSNRYFAGIPHGSGGSSYAIYVGNGGRSSITTTLGTRFTLDIVTTANKQLNVYKDGNLMFTTTYPGSVMTRQNAYLTSTVSTNVGHIFIFANHNSQKGTSNNAQQIISKMQLYAFKMLDNTSLVRNFIPCYRISDNVRGLYDTVEGKFYTNAGSGTFEIPT